MNKFGICLLSVIPVRKNPDDTSEMVTQLLFGDLVQITHRSKNWFRIRQEFDTYEGWIDEKQIHPINENTFKTLTYLPVGVVTDVVHYMKTNQDKDAHPVLFASSMPGFLNGAFYIGDIIYEYEGEYSTPEMPPSRSRVIENAMLLNNCPYLWGGKTPFGIDCSGFTQVVYKTIGIRLLRDTNQQVTQGETLHMLSEAHPGDLAFFDNKEGKINHVGILLGNNKVIHAHGKVRIDPIDHEGIFNYQLDAYSHKLRLIKRLID